MGTCRLTGKIPHRETSIFSDCWAFGVGLTTQATKKDFSRHSEKEDQNPHRAIERIIMAIAYVYSKVKSSIEQDVEAYRIVTCRDVHILQTIDSQR
jgi:hypothetical protein